MAERSVAADLQISPYLHRYADRIESPLTGQVLPVHDPLFARFTAQPAGHLHGDLDSAELVRLIAGGFVIDDVEATSKRSRLLYASIETCSVCNHRCSFCPVSIAPREAEVMPQDRFIRIVDDVVRTGEPDVAIFLNNYNEPTVDPLFLERLEVLLSRPVRTALLTNASKLTPDKVERIRALGRLRYLGINLPTIDPVRYKEMHGTDDLPKILANIEYLFDHTIAEENVFVVLGYDDPRHEVDLEGIRQAYGDRGFTVRKFRLQNRAGLVDAPLTPAPRQKLAGCELVGSRPLQHLHVVASGKAVFCCQDYYEQHVVGDLERQSVAEVLASDEMARLRRWAYGAEEAPADFMCRNCEFSLVAET